MRTRTRARAIAIPATDPRSESLVIGGLLCAGLCDAIYFLIFTFN